MYVSKLDDKIIWQGEMYTIHKSCTSIASRLVYIVSYYFTLLIQW